MNICQILAIIMLIIISNSAMSKPGKKLKKIIRKTPGLVAIWDFKEKEGKNRRASGKGKFPLVEMNGGIQREKEGPISGHSARFTGENYLSMPNSETKALNIYGEKQGVTVMAWIKWTGEQTGFIGGMWNEYLDGGKRQYGLFVSLPHYNGRDQVCGHISLSGKPTPPFPYSLDYSASAQNVQKDQWQYVAITYDGTHIRSYLNGEFEERAPELIDHTKGFEGYSEGMVHSKNPYYFPYGMGDNGSDFTVGAVLLKAGMGNFFKGLIGGLAVFDRALTPEEIQGFSLY